LSPLNQGHGGGKEKRNAEAKTQGIYEKSGYW